MRKHQLSKEEVNKSIALLIVIMIGIIAALLVYRDKVNSKKDVGWDDTDYGDIVVTPSDEETEEIPENIFDAYGLEYEYRKIPSLGFSTYVPVGWEVKFEKDFLYFISPSGYDEDDYYINTEIAFCVTDVYNLLDTKNLIYIQDYISHNIRNHIQGYQFIINTVSNNQYSKIYDGDRLLGYYSQPSTVFTYEDDPMKGNWQPYTVFYQLNTNTTTSVFAAVVGPTRANMQIEEIGKTIAYNTSAYENTSFDSSTLENVKLKEVTIGDMTYQVKDAEDVELDSNGVYNLSNDVSSLAFNCKFYAKETYSLIDETLTDDYMEDIWIKTNDVIADNYTVWQEKERLVEPEYKILEEENVVLDNKQCKKVMWTVNLDISANSRKYVNAIMPAMYMTYLVPDGNYTYSYTISFTTYQKYSALNYLTKAMSLTVFNK